MGEVLSVVSPDARAVGGHPRDSVSIRESAHEVRVAGIPLLANLNDPPLFRVPGRGRRVRGGAVRVGVVAVQQVAEPELPVPVLDDSTNAEDGADVELGQLILRDPAERRSVVATDAEDGGAEPQRPPAVSMDRETPYGLYGAPGARELNSSSSPILGNSR